MRRFLVCLLMFFTIDSFAASKLSRELARKRIFELSSSKMLLDAIEVREITMDTPSRATVETTITLAFQFKKTDQGAWAVDAIRFGDRDWVNMSELLAAIYHGNPPGPPAPPSIPIVRPVSPIEALHVNQNEFEKERARMVELGASPLIPGAIEVRRVIAQNDVRTIAESTVTMGFSFIRDARTNDWRIAAARLGDRPWINTVDLIATLNEGRRRETQTIMEQLAAAIEKYRKEKGVLPPAKDIAELTDILHPDYISGLFREDGWGQEIQYSASGSTFRLRSKGPDGKLFTADDIVVNPGPVPVP